MKTLKWCVLAGVVAAALTVGGLTYRQRRQEGKIRHLRSENSRLRGEAYRRVAAAAASAQTGAAAARARPAEAVTTARTAAAPEEYRNEGRATARAALQTLAWSCDRGDLETLTKLMRLEPAARVKVDDYYASLPADVRSRWKSADEMVATFVSVGAQMSPFPSADVLAAAVMEPAGEDRLLLRIPGTNKDRLSFQRDADGSWSYTMDAAMMDRLFAVAKNLPPPVR